MNFPVNIPIGHATIPSHFVFEMLAFFIGYRYYSRLRQNQTDLISTENRLWIFIGAAGGAFLFSRIIGNLEDPKLFFDPSTHFSYYLNNRTIVGGLLGGLLGVELIKKIIGEKSSSGDLFTYPLILGMIIGRIGCFLAGTDDHTYGIESHLPWAMDLGDGIKRHPTNLYEMLFLAILWLFIFLLDKRRSLVNGAKFKIFLFSYLIFRLLVEFIKPDVAVWWGLSTIQLCCVAGILYYYRMIIHPKHLITNPS